MAMGLNKKGMFSINYPPPRKSVVNKQPEKVVVSLAQCVHFPVPARAAYDLNNIANSTILSDNEKRSKYMNEVIRKVKAARFCFVHIDVDSFEKHIDSTIKNLRIPHTGLYYTNKLCEYVLNACMLVGKFLENRDVGIIKNIIMSAIKESQIRLLEKAQ